MRTFIILCIAFLALVSSGTYAQEANWESVSQKVDCIIKNGGMYSKQAEVCFERVPTVVQSKSVAVSKKSLARVKRDKQGYFHWKKVGGAPVKTVLKKMAKQAQPETFIGKKLHDDLIAMELTSRDMEKVFHPIFDESLDMLGLLKGEAKEKHEKEWNQMLSNGSRYIGIIQQGDELEYLSFDKKVVNNVIVDFDTPRLGYVFPLEGDRELVWLKDCWNFAIRKTKEIPKPPKEPTQEEPPQEPFKVSLRKEENERRAIVEVNAGVWGGAYFGDKYEGQFVGGQAWVYVPIEDLLQTEEQISAGIGVYSSADWGDSRVTAFKHERARVLGMLGIKGNGFDEDFNPHWWSVNFGYGPDWLKGGNRDSGYWFKQKTWLGRMYAEYLTQRGEMLYALFGEGFLDFGGGGHNYQSSWSGFPGEGESSARVGGYAEWRFHPNWSVKGVAAMTFGQSDGATSRFGAELGAYGCYRNGWDQGYGFAIACAGGGVNIGQGVVPYVGANVFAGKVFTSYVEHKRATGVQYVPHPSRIPGATTPAGTTIHQNTGKDSQPK